MRKVTKLADTVRGVSQNMLFHKVEIEYVDKMSLTF